MRTASNIALGSSVLMLLACCGGFNPFAPKPSSLSYGPLPEIVTDPMPIDLKLAVLDEQKKPIPDLKVEATADPAELAVVTSTGGLRCLGSGDINLNLRYEQLTQTAIVKCRLVESLGAPTALRVNLGSPQALVLKPVDAKGKEVGDVPITLNVTDPTVLKVEGTRLTPVMIGSTTIIAEGGGKRVEIPVTVVRQLITDSIALRDGEGMTWALPSGNYEVEVKIKRNQGEQDGVTLSWMETLCPSTPETQEILQVCRVERAASLIITNPTTFGLGPQVVGLINVYQIP